MMNFFLKKIGLLEGEIEKKTNKKLPQKKNRVNPNQPAKLAI
jgi:hypothetical protein